MNTPANPYPNYKYHGNEQVRWFAAPVEIGTYGGMPIVALGLGLVIGPEAAPRTVEHLIADAKATPGNRPVMLGRMMKFSPAVVSWDRPALERLAAEHRFALP